MLREAPNVAFQFLLADSVRLLREELHQHKIQIGEDISLDTKHILAWVKENNPKTYVEGRYDKTKQPAGDPDCKLGCKRRHNKKKKQPLGQGIPPTPRINPQPAENFKFGDFYWGYGSGVVVTKVPGWGEIVLAENARTFICRKNSKNQVSQHCANCGRPQVTALQQQPKSACHC